jgi:hypothetical protein
MTFPGAPPIDPRQRRHSTKTMALARRMYGAGNSWTPTQIKNYLATNGVRVSLNTIRLWVIPGMADEHRHANKANAARRQARKNQAPPPVGPAAPVGLLDRMLALRHAGLPFVSIAKVIDLDYGVVMSGEQVRYYIRTRREPKQPKKKARRG